VIELPRRARGRGERAPADSRSAALLRLLPSPLLDDVEVLVQLLDVPEYRLQVHRLDDVAPLLPRRLPVHEQPLAPALPHVLLGAQERAETCARGVLEPAQVEDQSLHG